MKHITILFEFRHGHIETQIDVQKRPSLLSNKDSLENALFLAAEVLLYQYDKGPRQPFSYHPENNKLQVIRVKSNSRFYLPEWWKDWDGIFSYEDGIQL